MNETMKKILTRAGPFLGLFVVVVLFWLAVPLDDEKHQVFLSYHNFKTIFTQTVIVAIGALGMTLIIVSGGIDLSAGSSIAFTSVVGALAIRAGFGSVAVLAIAIAAGGLVGLINGVLVAGLRLVPFIITLGTLCIVRGAAQRLGNNQTVNYDASPINQWMTTPDPFSRALPPGVWITLGVAVLTAVLLRRTVFGRHIFALGSNEATARLCGISTARVKVAIYALGGCFFGLAGLFQLSRLRVGDPTAAVGLELDIIAAVIVGGASLNGGIGTILGTMIGALTMAVLRNGSQLMGWENSEQLMIIGVVIIAAVFIDRLRQGRQT